jgi:hypothetical protein
MATSNNIIRLADFPSRRDPVASARADMDRAGGDGTYMAAADRLVSSTPSTTAGALYQLEELRVLIEAFRGGDDVSADAMLELLRGPERFLSGLSRKVG